MTVELNHTIVWCTDKAKSAAFLTNMLGLPPARTFMHFLVVDLSNGVSLDYFQKEGPIALQHYAFLVSEDDFDRVLSRINANEIPYWADPARSQPNAINHHFGGRGVYFQDPDGHLMEAITRPYGDPATLS